MIPNRKKAENRLNKRVDYKSTILFFFSVLRFCLQRVKTNPKQRIKKKGKVKRIVSTKRWRLFFFSFIKPVYKNRNFLSK